MNSRRFGRLGLVALALLSVASTCEVGDTTGFIPGSAEWSIWNIPLQIRVEDYPAREPSSAHRRSAAQAVAAFNDAAGLTLYEITTDPMRGADVVLTFDAPSRPELDPGVLGYAERQEEPDFEGEVRLVGCTIGLTDAYEIALTSLIIQHELGHCVGLAHDQTRASIMYPELAVPDSGFPPALTGADAKRLRQRYRRGP